MLWARHGHIHWCDLNLRMEGPSLGPHQFTLICWIVELLTVKIFFNVSSNHGKDGSTGDLHLPMEAQALVPTRLHQPGNTHSLTGWLFSAESSKICYFLTKTTPSTANMPTSTHSLVAACFLIFQKPKWIVWTRPDQTQPNQTKPDPNQPNQPNQTKPDKTRPFFWTINKLKLNIFVMSYFTIGDMTTKHIFSMWHISPSAMQILHVNDNIYGCR